MEENNKVPMLLEFLFAYAAQTAQRGASPRLIRWAAAFDQWLAERGRVYKPCTTKHARHTWQRLLRERRLMPWEMNQEHIEGHAAWMEAQGYAASTIYNALGTIAQFFRWCDDKQIDPQCAAGFNPAAGVVRPKIKLYAQAQLLSRGELSALLGILQQDDSPLGKRDYAFFLARLRVGVPLKALQQLQWGQIQEGDQEVWVRWRPRAATDLPEDVWQAIQDYLRASGRLAGVQDGDYIFAPLAEPGMAGKTDTPEDWVGR
jgi:site-specific recombinase XerC